MSRVLIAEDEARIAAFLRKGLRAAGFATEVAPDGRAALDAALGGTHDLLLLDLGLPELDGFGVLQALREAGSRLPVVVLTAQEGVGPRLASLGVRPEDYLTKPFRFDDLLARVRGALEAEA